MISRAIKQKVIDETNIVEVVNEYVPLIKKGNSYLGLCPFHNDSNPSMSVNNDKKVFNCFSCGAKGTVIRFVARHENISDDEATIKLANRLGITINVGEMNESAKNERLYKVMAEATDFYRFYLRNSEEGIKALEYLYNRGITDEIIDKFQIGLAPDAYNYLALALKTKKISELDQIELGLIRTNNDDNPYDVFRNRIMFPITNSYSKIVAFSGRIYTKSDQAKYVNSNETPIFHKSDVLYNFSNASSFIRQTGSVYLFEGFMDVIAAEKADIKNAVATMGTALTKEHIRLLQSVAKNIILCFDGDSAGIIAMKRSTALLAKEKIIPQAVLIPDNMDPDEYLNKYGKKALNDFLSTKAIVVYNQLYNLAYKKLDRQDLMSVANFKKEIFEMLKIANSTTISDFFLKKMAEDLEVSYETVVKDFQKDNNDFIYDNQKQKQVVVNQKSIKINAATIKAYNTILRHCFYYRNRFLEAEATEAMYTSEKELLNQVTIYVIIHDYYNNYDDNKVDNDYYLNKISDNPELLKVGLDIIENVEYDEKIPELFIECLDKYQSYLKKKSIEKSKIIAQNGDSEATKNYINEIKQTKKIIKEEA